MRITTAADVHRTLFAMLREIDVASQRCGARYFLAYGTALGAVRDGGIIPWDLDADVLVPVEDYSELIQQLRERLPAPMEVVSCATQGYEHMFARVSLVGLDHNLVHVDLFPIAGASGFAFVRRLETKIAKFVNTAFMLKVASPRLRYAHSTKRRWIAEVFHWPLKLIPRAVLLRAYKWLGRRQTTEASYCFNISGSYGAREIIDTAWVIDGQDVDMEGYRFRAPGPVDDYLSHTYGDFRVPVSLAEQERALAFFSAHKLPRILAWSEGSAP